MHDWFKRCINQENFLPGFLMVAMLLDSFQHKNIKSRLQKIRA
jgi:hypothetical protein